MTELFNCEYGSRLYGTNTPESDIDLKTIYLPDLGSLLLLNKVDIFKIKTDKDGNRVSTQKSAEPGDIENEFIPFQRFCRDFIAGQTYAVEILYSTIAKQNAPSWMLELGEKFSNNGVASMVAFARKQTFDYVKRGERLNEARKVMKAISDAKLDGMLALAKADNGGEVRLDTMVNGTSILDIIAEQTGTPIGSCENNSKVLRTLELNGRSYLETSNLDHLARAIKKLIDTYGDRVHDAAAHSVDFKSIMHAIRVYQQAIELLDTGTITFPRPNAAYLLSVKQGKEDMSEIKALLVKLDDEVTSKIQTSSLRQSTPELVEASEAWLVGQLWKLYDLRASS